MLKKIAAPVAVLTLILLTLSTISSAVVPTYGIVKGTEKLWAQAQCYNGTTELPCAEHWIIGAGSENPASGYGSNGDLFWRTDLARFQVKAAGAWAAGERALQPYGIPIFDLRQTTGVHLAATETAGNFNVSVAANVILAKGEVTDIETEVSVTQFQFVIPPNYVPAGDLTIRLPANIVKTAAAVNNGSTIDVAVYEQGAGAVGSDLSTTTAAATFAAVDTWYNKDFVITATNLVAGDTLNVVITSSVVDSEAGGGTLILNLGTPSVLLDTYN